MFFALRKRHTVPTILFLLSLTSLFVSFQYNYFTAAKQDWFQGHQFDSEALVIGRLVKSQTDGILSDGARLGRYGGHSGDQNRAQTNLYTEQITGGNFHGYDSQIGIQGLFFSAIDKITRSSSLTAEERLNFYHSLNAFLLALTLSLIVLIFYYELGMGAALFVIATTIASQWLVVFGRNLYWVTWTMYLPMLAIFILHKYEEKYEEKYEKFSIVLTCLLAFILIFIKSAAGYEYISTILIAAVAPILYFSVKNHWPIMLLMRRMLLIGSALVAGFVLANLVHVMQQANVNSQSFIEALQGRLDHAQTRLHTEEGASIGGGMWDRATLASVFEVVNRYWNGEAINLHNLFSFKHFKVITFGDLVLVFAVFSALGLMADKYSRNIAANRATVIALIATTWFCLTAPLSWFILAKIHSYVHGHMNHLLWHIPFTIFGFALTGYIISLKIKDILTNKIMTAALLITIATISGSFWIYTNHQKNKVLENLHSNTFYTHTTAEGMEISLFDDQIAYYHPQCKKMDLKHRFFLHAYPAKSQNPGQFEGLDFNWHEKKIYQPGLFSFFDQSCLAIQTLPDRELRAIRTGQFKVTHERIWNEYINLNHQIPVVAISAYNLSDVRWLNGIARDGKAFFVEKTEAHQKILIKGEMLIFADGSQRKILRVDDSNKFINIALDGKPISAIANGFPNVIKVIQKQNNESRGSP